MCTLFYYNATCDNSFIYLKIATSVKLELINSCCGVDQLTAISIDYH